MSDRYLPVFAPQDYDAFRGIIGPDIPDTYDEWLQLDSKHKTDILRMGENVLRIEVHPDEFIRFCSTRGAAHNLASLQRFTVEKSRGHSY